MMQVRSWSNNKVAVSLKCSGCGNGTCFRVKSKRPGGGFDVIDFLSQLHRIGWRWPQHGPVCTNCRPKK